MFAQESVMDLQKEREAFEKECRLLCYKGNMVMSNLGSFYNNEQTNWMWQMWLSAKAQAVLEKDAIIQKLSDQLYAQEMKTSDARVLCETACELLDGYAHQDAMVILNDLEQAMKEPAND